MNFNTSRRLFLGLFATTLVTPLLSSSAFAHEAPCPYCNQTVTQDTPTQDNEVALKIGRKRIEYKCVYCALSEAATEYEGDLSILAPSEKKGEPVLLKRTGSKWSASSDDVTFVFKQPLKHPICQEQARAFSTKAAATVYLAANKDKLPDARTLSLAEMVEITKGK